MLVSEDRLSVLFVCTANICRSVFAQLLASHMTGGRDGLDLRSAGTHGWIDQPMDEVMADQLVARGGDPTGFRSRRLTMDMIDGADLVLTAEVAHRSFILGDRPAAFRRMFTLGQFDHILDDLPADLSGRDLLAASKKALQPANRDDDVPDPYRGGVPAAGAAAVHIEELLGRIMPRLV